MERDSKFWHPWCADERASTSRCSPTSWVRDSHAPVSTERSSISQSSKNLAKSWHVTNSTPSTWWWIAWCARRGSTVVSPTAWKLPYGSPMGWRRWRSWARATRSVRSSISANSWCARSAARRTKNSRHEISRSIRRMAPARSAWVWGPPTKWMANWWYPTPTSAFQKVP